MLKKGATIQVVGYPHKEVGDEMRAERIFINGNKFELR
jgi:formylmethanofuran dehydrogenase subunit C